MNLDVHHCWEGSSFDWALAEYFHINCSSYTSCWLIRLQTVNSTQNHIIYTDHKYVKISNKIKNEILHNLKWTIRFSNIPNSLAILLFMINMLECTYFEEYFPSLSKYYQGRNLNQLLQLVLRSIIAKLLMCIICIITICLWFYLCNILTLIIRLESIHYVSGIDYYLCFGKLKL